MTKGPLAQAAWDEFTDQEKAEINEMTAQKMEVYDSLRALRMATGLTQAKVSEELGMRPNNISRLERGSDMLLSTLQRYVAAIGGKLNLTVELPDRPPVTLTGLSDLIEPTEPES